MDTKEVIDTKSLNCFNKLKDYMELQNFFNDRAYSHTDNCHYTKLSIIDKILNRQFYVSCVTGFNDDCDKNQFGDKNTQKYFYSLCFSTGTSENLALWYLYSGVNGHGGRVQLTKVRLKQLIQNSTYELCEYDINKKQILRSLIKLENDKNMRLQVKDVLYYQKQGQTVRLKYNNATNNEFSLTEFEKFEKEYNGFLKNLIWYYEKETRLVIELINEARENIDFNKNYVVVMKFPEDFKIKWLNVKLAPEVTNEDYWNIIKDENYTKIHDFLKNTSNLKLSEHSGQIHMNICNKCDIKSQLEEEKNKCKECKYKDKN